MAKAIAVAGVKVDWQLVPKKKKGSKQKHAAVPEHTPIGFTTQNNEELSPGSPSLRSEASTKDTDGPFSRPDSPTMMSSRSAHSTDVPTAALDQSALTEESCSLQGSASGASLPEGLSALEEVEKVLAKYRELEIAFNDMSPDDEEFASTPVPVTLTNEPEPSHLSGTLSQAMRMCTQSEGEQCSANSAQQNAASTAPARTAAPAQALPQLSCSHIEIASDSWPRLGAQQPQKKGGRKPRPQQVSKSSKDNASIVCSSGIADAVKAEIVVERSAVKAVSTHEVCMSSVEELDPLATTWVHNGCCGEAAEWNLLIFQPLWSCKTPDAPHVPVSIQAVDAGVRLVIKNSFYSMVPTLDRPRRARSLDARLRVQML